MDKLHKAIAKNKTDFQKSQKILTSGADLGNLIEILSQLLGVQGS
jgi:hypothetical protein